MMNEPHIRHSSSSEDHVAARPSGQRGNVLTLVLILLVVAVGAGMWWYNQRPAQVTPEAEAYFKSMPEVLRERNGWFVLMGLDIMPESAPLEAGMDKYDIMRGQAAHGPVPPELEFKGDINLFGCWVNGHPDAEGCPDKTALDQILSDNFDLLTRLETLSSFLTVAQLPGTGNVVSKGLVENLFHLKMAELTLLISEDRPEDALEVWINGWRMLRNLSLSWVDLEWRDSFAGLLNEWTGLFPLVMEAGPKQLEEGGKRRLFYLLRPLRLEDMDFDGRLKNLGFLLVEQTLDRSGFHGAERDDMEKRLKNLYYAHVQEMDEYLEKPSVQEIYAGLMHLREEEEEESKTGTYHIYDDRPLAVVEYFHEEGLDPLIGAFQADLANNDYSRMFIIDIDAYDKHIPAENMQAYLDVQQDFMQSQITGKPFVWDPESKDIYFIAPDNLERRLKVLYPGKPGAPVAPDEDEGTGIEADDGTADEGPESTQP